MEKRLEAIRNGQFGVWFVEQREFSLISGIWGDWQVVADFPTLEKARQFVSLGGKKIARRIFNYAVLANID